MASVDRLVWSASLDLSCMYGGQVSSAGKPGGQKPSVGPNNMFIILGTGSTCVYFPDILWKLSLTCQLHSWEDCF